MLQLLGLLLAVQCPPDAGELPARQHDVTEASQELARAQRAVPGDAQAIAAADAALKSATARLEATQAAEAACVAEAEDARDLLGRCPGEAELREREARAQNSDAEKRAAARARQAAERCERDAQRSVFLAGVQNWEPPTAQQPSRDRCPSWTTTKTDADQSTTCFVTDTDIPVYRYTTDKKGHLIKDELFRRGQSELQRTYWSPAAPGCKENSMNSDAERPNCVDRVRISETATEFSCIAADGTPILCSVFETLKKEPQARDFIANNIAAGGKIHWPFELETLTTSRSYPAENCNTNGEKTTFYCTPNPTPTAEIKINNHTFNILATDWVEAVDGTVLSKISLASEPIEDCYEATETLAAAGALLRSKYPSVKADRLQRSKATSCHGALHHNFLTLKDKNFRIMVMSIWSGGEYTVSIVYQLLPAERAAERLEKRAQDQAAREALGKL